MPSFLIYVPIPPVATPRRIPHSLIRDSLGSPRIVSLSRFRDFLTERALTYCLPLTLTSFATSHNTSRKRLFSLDISHGSPIPRHYLAYTPPVLLHPTVYPSHKAEPSRPISYILPLHFLYLNVIYYAAALYATHPLIHTSPL